MRIVRAMLVLGLVGLLVLLVIRRFEWLALSLLVLVQVLAVWAFGIQVWVNDGKTDVLSFVLPGLSVGFYLLAKALLGLPWWTAAWIAVGIAAVTILAGLAERRASRE